MLLMPYTPFQHTYAFPFHRTDRRNTRKFIQKRRGKVWVVKKVSLSPPDIFFLSSFPMHTLSFFGRIYIHKGWDRRLFSPAWEELSQKFEYGNKFRALQHYQRHQHFEVCLKTLVRVRQGNRPDLNFKLLPLHWIGSFYHLTHPSSLPTLLPSLIFIPSLSAYICK